MKKILNSIIYLLIGFTVIAFGVEVFSEDESPALPETQVEASEPFKEELATLEERLKSVYTDDSEQDVNLKTYKEVSPSIKEMIEQLNKEPSLDEATEKFQVLTDEWQVIQDMAYVKDHLEKRFDDGEIVSDKEVPKDFEKRLKRLEKPKPEFYKTYQKRYKEYQKVLEAQQEAEEELAHIRESLLLGNGMVNPDLLDVELITYRNRLEILGDPELIALIDEELNYREQEREALAAQQAAEAERQREEEAARLAEAEAQRAEEESAREAARRAEEEAAEQQEQAEAPTTDRRTEPATNRKPPHSEPQTPPEKEDTDSSEPEDTENQEEEKSESDSEDTSDEEEQQDSSEEED